MQTISIGLCNVKQIAKAKNVTPQTIWQWDKKGLLEENGITKAGKNFYLAMGETVAKKLITVIYTPKEFATKTNIPLIKIYRDLKKGEKVFMANYHSLPIKLGSGRSSKYAIMVYSYGNHLICPRPVTRSPKYEKKEK